MREEGSGPSVLKVVGCGCAALFVTVLLGVGTCTYVGYRQLEELQAQRDDPRQAAEEVHEVLGTAELPPGYHPASGLHVPFLLDVAMLSDRKGPPGGDGGIGEIRERAGFSYISMLSFGPDPTEARERYRTGLEQTDDPPAGAEELLEHPPGDEMLMSSVSGEILRRGEVPVAGGRARYVATREELSSETSPGLVRLTTHLEIDCEEDGRIRKAEWFEVVAGGEPELTGTPADPEAVEGFLGHFRLCP